MKVTKSQLKELISHTIVELTEKTFRSQAQYDAYRKKHNLKPGSKHKVAGKTVTVRDTKKMSKKAKSLGDRMADKLNKRMADLEKKRKQGKIKESKKRRYTVKEVRMWMKKLEENRYKKVYNSDARRVAWMVNNEGVSLDEMPESMKKKWTKAQYGRERYLATEFLKSKSEQLSEGLDLKKLETAIKDFQKKIKKQGRVTNARDEEHLKQLIKVYKQMGGKKIKEQKLREQIREIIRNELNEAPKPIHHSDMRMLYVPKKDFKNAVKLLRLNIKHGNVEVEKKPSSKVKGFYRFSFIIRNSKRRFYISSQN